MALTITLTATDLEVLQQWAQESQGACRRCQFGKLYRADIHLPELHLRDHLVTQVAHVANNILLLSLVETDLEDIRLHFDGSLNWESTRNGTDFYGALCRLAFKSLPVFVGMPAVLEQMHRLLDSEAPEPSSKGGVIASAAHGQVLFPRMFQNIRLDPQKCLGLLIIPGFFNRTGRPYGPRYRAIIGRHCTPPFLARAIVPYSQVKTPSQFNSVEYEWRTSIDRDCLITTMSTKQTNGTLVAVDPYRILVSTSKLVFRGSCRHKTTERLCIETENYQFVHPANFSSIQAHPGPDILIFASEGNDPIQMMILGALNNFNGLNRAVVGQKACLACSLSLCRQIGCKYLIC